MAAKERVQRGSDWRRRRGEDDMQIRRIEGVVSVELNGMKLLKNSESHWKFH